jgi:hypothetical protein
MTSRILLLGAFTLSLLLSTQPVNAQTQRAPKTVNISTPLDWPVHEAPQTGIDFYIKTKWEDARMHYVVTLDDKKKQLDSYFLKTRGGVVPVSSFQATFYDSDGFKLFTLFLQDNEFKQLAGTSQYRVASSSPCTEKVYRALVAGDMDWSYASVLAKP